MFIYNIARKANKQLKKIKKNRAGKFMSPCRRIEFVYPPSNGRYVAMTFDDGPTVMPTTSDKNVGLTDAIIDTLNDFDAKGTFDVIGTTHNNYPDSEGKLGDFTWSGVHYDHYPVYGDDLSAGAVNCPQLIKKILSTGHEITSHTYSHTLFGPMRAIYGARKHYFELSDVVADLGKLHKYMSDNFDYTIKLSRPPHYIDNIPDKSSAYDAYRIMGYNYLAASFDGAGWQPCSTYKEEVDAMINPLRAALDNDPDSLNGKIIFQKDGCNMNMRTPVADALSKQLEILTNYGYKVITVSELMNISPFEDFNPDTEEIKYIRKLLLRGCTVGYKNNTFAPDRYITIRELGIMCADPSAFRIRSAVDYDKMCLAAMRNCNESGIIFNTEKKLGNAILDIAMAKSLDVDEKSLKDKTKVLRKDVLQFAACISDMRIGNNSYRSNYETI